MDCCTFPDANKMTDKNRNSLRNYCENKEK